LADNGKELQVEFDARFRQKPDRVVLHIPPVAELATIIVNAVDQKWNRQVRTLLLDSGH
jgi:hypothetical protein